MSKLENTRVLWLSFLYNWETREKEIALLDDFPLFQKPKRQGDHLYRASFTLHPPDVDGEFSRMELESIREEWETMDRKPDDMPTEVYVMRHLNFDRAVPPFSYGPDIGPFMSWWDPCGKPNVREFSLPDGKYRITVEKIG